MKKHELQSILQNGPEPKRLKATQQICTTILNQQKQLNLIPEERTKFWQFLSDVMRLPERFRVPIMLYYYLGFSTSEIAELLHVPAATVRTRLARGRSKLKFILEEGDREIQSNQAGLRVRPSR